MATETDKFELADIQRNDIQSREIRADRMQSTPVRGEIRSALVTCKSCCYSWTARESGSGLRRHIGGFTLKCPSCEAEGKVYNRSLA